MGQFGEPWGTGEVTCLGGGENCYGAIYGADGQPLLRACKHGDGIWGSDVAIARLIACVNAMAGIPDPAAFVVEARKAMPSQ